MPLIRCIRIVTRRNAGKPFIHPDQPQWAHAPESSLTKRRRAEAAAAAAAYGSRDRDSGYGSRSKGGRDSGRGSITSSTSGWGDTRSSRASPDRPRRDASPGWGTGNTGGGWGDSNNSGGWAAPASGGWGEASGNDWGNKSGDGSASGGWGERANPEPSPRQTPSAPKSPRAPRSPRQRETDKSPSRRQHSSSKDKDRGREKDRDRRQDDNSSQSSRAHRRSPSPKHSSKASSRKQSPERAKPDANDQTDIDTPNPSSIGAASLSTSVHKDSSAAPAPATTQPLEPTPTTEMPISIAFPRARQPDGLPPPPLGFGAPSVPRTPSAPAPAAQSMPPPPPPLSAPPVIPPPPVTASKASSKSPPQSSNATHSLPARPPGATGSRSPPQTRTTATPMQPHGSSKSPATPATPATPAAPVTPATQSAERPHEWIESLESLIKQNRVLQNCKQQYARAEVQEKMLLNRGGSGGPRRGLGDTAPSLADMRRRIESTESEMQVLLRQFAARMEVFYRPSEVIKDVDMSAGNEETLSMARKLSDQVSLLESEMQLLQITTVKTEEFKKLEETIKSGSQAVLKERGERTKAVEDVKKDVKVLGEDLNRTKIECDRLREELVSTGANFDQVRCDAQTVREQQNAVKEEVKAVKVEADATKADVQTVKTKMGEVGKEVAEIKAEMEKLKTKLKTPPSSPAPARAPHPAVTPGKRARNGGVSPGSSSMEMDDVFRPAKRVRTVDPIRPSPFVDSTTPVGSPGRHGGPSHMELLERIDSLEDLVETLQGDLLQVGIDVQDQLEELNERLGLSDERVTNAPMTEARSESAPPSSSAKTDVARPAARSSAPPPRTRIPASWGPTQLPAVEELPSDEAIGTIRVDLDAMMGQVVALWNGEADWPAHIQMNLCKALKVESLDQVFKPPPPEPVPRVVNGKKHEPDEDWVQMFRSMKEEQANMREEMKKERMEHEARMKAMMARLERTEEALDHSMKSREKVEREYEALKTQQEEQRQLLIHLQSVVDNLPKPGNGMLSPEGLLHDAVKNGASPVQQELAALRKLATTVPALLSLAGLSAEKEA